MDKKAQKNGGSEEHSMEKSGGNVFRRISVVTGTPEQELAWKAKLTLQILPAHQGSVASHKTMPERFLASSSRTCRR